MDFSLQNHSGFNVAFTLSMLGVSAPLAYK